MKNLLVYSILKIFFSIDLILQMKSKKKYIMRSTSNRGIFYSNFIQLMTFTYHMFTSLFYQSRFFLCWFCSFLPSVPVKFSTRKLYVSTMFTYVWLTNRIYIFASLKK